MQNRKLYVALSAVLGVVVAGCGGSNRTSALPVSTLSLFSQTDTGAVTSTTSKAGIDANDRIVLVQSQTTNGTVTALTERTVSGTKMVAFPTGYTLNSLLGASGHYIFANVNDSTGSAGLLLLNVDTQTPVFEAGRTFVTVDADRVVTALTNSTGANSDYRIETLASAAATVSSTQNLTLPSGAGVVELAGNYALITTTSSGTTTYSLYTASGTKVLDYAAPSGTTLGHVGYINDNGEAVGTVQGTVSGTTGSFGVHWNNSGSATFLPGGGLNVDPQAISNAGVITGTYSPVATDVTQNVVYLYKDGKQQALTSLTGVNLAFITLNGKDILTLRFGSLSGSSTTTLAAYTLQ